ncbi:MAG TPA: hypothetical protein VJ862_01005 [Rhodanobacteraceae bacterium]|nr:hypothetical protein [Rhodanobacteraceae bacterium]
MKTLKKMIAIGLAGAMALGIAFTASAEGNATTEVGTAQAHAMMAQSANTVAMAHTHLHHVINCLVGPNGQGYDAKAGTPCKGQGNGAIPDSMGNSALHANLQGALADAQAGLRADSLATVHSDAGKAATALQAGSAPSASAGKSW